MSKLHVTINPTHPPVNISELLQHALTAHQQEKLDEAEVIYRQILSQQPKHFDALHMLGLVRKRLGHLEEGLDLYNQATMVKADFPSLWCNRGVVLFDLGKHEEAVASYDKAVALQADYPMAWNNRGNALTALGKHQEATESYQRAKPTNTIAVAKTNSEAVWKALTDTGVQAESYPDFPRKDMYQMFLHPPKRVLDIGCATGAVGLGIKNTYTDSYVWGCELNEGSAAIAKGRLDLVTTIPMGEWNTEELTALKTIDTVLFLDVLEHMYNPWGELELLSKHISADTQVIVSLPNIGHMSILSGLNNGRWSYSKHGILDITHLRFFAEQDMINMFEQTGFQIVRKVYGQAAPAIDDSRFPVWVDVGSDLKLLAKDKTHWQQLHAIQIFFSIKLKN